MAIACIITQKEKTKISFFALGFVCILGPKNRNRNINNFLCKYFNIANILII